MIADDRPVALRVGYRFAVIYAILYALSFPFDRLPGPFVPIANAYARGVYAVESWVAKAVFGITTPLEFIHHPSGGGDTTTDFIRLFCILVVATVGSAVWMLAAPRRAPPWILPHLQTYLRYFLATAMLLYGMGKVVPEGQFAFPSLDYLQRPLGDLGRSDLLPAFMGSSYLYTLFAGLGETIGGLLLLFRRTAPLGGLLLIPILLNVLVMNAAYGWDVKVGAGHYLLIAALLAAPLLHRLVRLSLTDRSVAPVAIDTPILARLPRTRLLLKATFISWIGWLAIGQVWHLPAQRGDARKTAFFGIWDVEAMEIGGRALPPALTEGRRWRTVTFERNHRVVVRRMSDSLRYFRASVDTSAGTLRLTRRGDTIPLGSFVVTRDGEGRLTLLGDLDSLPTRLTLTPSRRTFRLRECRVQLIVDRPC